MANTTNIVPSRVQLVDPATGNITREWYRFFLNMFDLTGAGNNDDSIVVALVTPPTLEAQFDTQIRLEPFIEQLSSLQFAFETQPPTTPSISPLPVIDGGTEKSSFTDGQILVGKTGGTPTLVATTITAETGILVTNGPGSIKVKNIGVTSLTAGSGISLDASTGAITITCTVSPVSGATGSFKSGDTVPKTITVANGIITGIT